MYTKELKGRIHTREIRTLPSKIIMLGCKVSESQSKILLKLLKELMPPQQRCVADEQATCLHFQTVNCVISIAPSPSAYNTVLWRYE
jgi:hypothetical protein